MMFMIIDDDDKNNDNKLKRVQVDTLGISQSKKPASTVYSRDRPFDMTCNTTYNFCQLLAYLSGFLSKTAKAQLYP
jgi:hypothetical protein